METNDYLQAILTDQNLAEDSAELQDLRDHRSEVETTLRDGFPDASPRIRYAGSYRKGTLIRESYDLDIACFFPAEDDDAGETLEDIYNNAHRVLASKYAVEPRRSALRLRVPGTLTDLHIDVVPGRFIDESEGDCFLYQANAEKCRLKTNLDVHIGHITRSGVVPAIRLSKLWKVRRALSLKQFVFELLVVQELGGMKSEPLDKQLIHLWETIRDSADPILVEDPANPVGNDLSPLLSDSWSELSQASATALRQIENFGWEGIFGPVPSRVETAAKLQRAAASASVHTKPWLP